MAYCRAIVVIAALCAANAEAQIVNGHVVDQSGRPVVAARVVLIDAGREQAQALSDEAGSFRLTAPRPASYRLAVSRLGYRSLTTDTIGVAHNQIVTVTLRIAEHAIPLEPLSVVARSRDFLHDASFDGLYARRSQAIPVGNTRIFVKGDRDFEAAIRPSDLLRLMKPRKEEWVTDDITRARKLQPCFPIVFWHGFLLGGRAHHDKAESMLYGSVDYLEGVEIYRDYTSVPMEYRHQLDPGAATKVRECGLVALWPRRPDYPKR